MSKRTSRLIAAALFAVLVAAGALASLARAGQEKGNSSDKKEDIIELNKYELATTVTITPVATDLTTVKQQYRASQPDDKQIILISMTNTGAEPVRVAIGDPHVQYRPSLSKNGRPVPYKEGLGKILQAKNINGPGSVRVTGGILKPNETVKVDYIDLADWYGALEPGQYELTLKFRFRPRGRPIGTNTVTFEIVP